MRFARIVCLAAACAPLTAASTVFADQTIAPMPVRPPAIVSLKSPWLATLRRVAATGDGERLVQTAFEALADLRRADPAGGCCDPSHDYILVSFVGADAAGEPVLVTVLVHDPMPQSVELPGIHGAGHPVYQLFLADDLTSSLQATYAITHEESRAEQQSGDFAAAVIGRLALPAAIRTLAPAAASHVVETFDVVVALDRVTLPEAGKITVRQTVAYAHPMGHLAARISAVDRAERAALDARYSGEAPGLACADVSAMLKARLDTAMAAGACGLWPADLAPCTKALRQDLAAAASAYFAAAPACPIESGAPIVQELAAVLQDVKAITSTFVILNAPLVRYGFGLAAAYIVRVDVDPVHPRAQLQSGRITSDPFPRQLTMGVVNLTPWGYDAQRQSLSFAERARLVAGVAFSPYFGVTAGAAFAVNRYIALNAGYARLWFDTPKPGEQIDAAPTAANRSAPFDLRSTGALFVGLSYNFK